MSTIEEIDEVLKDCAAKLDGCAGDIRDLPLAPVRENIHRIGKALAEIFEIRNEIFKVNPALKPPEWDEPLPDAEYNRMFGQALLQAEEYRDAGKPEEAVKCYESFIFIGPPEALRKMAQNEIDKLKGKYGV